jgi:predicted Rossmann fold flavoprotein
LGEGKSAFWDCLIVGGGPAGLYCAIHAASRLKKVLVLEKMPSPARKLLISGGGKCNLTNRRPVREFFGAYGEASHGQFLKPALLNHPNDRSIEFFERLGIATKVVEENQKVFPQSARARDVLDAMLAECGRLGIEVRTGSPVRRVSRLEPRGFEVEAEGGTDLFRARNLVIATGGKSLPGTGSSGDGYGFATSLGHGLAPLRPGLTPFFIRRHALAGHAGMSFKDLTVALWRQGRKIVQRTGALVITHTGYSGPVIHNLGRDADPGDQVVLSFVTGRENFRGEFLRACEGHGSLAWGALLKTWPVPQALAETFLGLAGLDPSQKVARARRDRRLALATSLEAFSAELEALGGFDRAMVTCGGVSLEEVNPKSMESRKVPGLYFVGEVLDVDGDTGGYDLQAAWSTAYLAAGHISI